MAITPRGVHYGGNLRRLDWRGQRATNPARGSTAELRCWRALRLSLGKARCGVLFGVAAFY